MRWALLYLTIKIVLALLIITSKEHKAPADVFFETFLAVKLPASEPSRESYSVTNHLEGLCTYIAHIELSLIDTILHPQSNDSPSDRLPVLIFLVVKNAQMFYRLHISQLRSLLKPTLELLMGFIRRQTVKFSR